MSARIRSTKLKNLQSKSIKIMSKTITSNFFKPSAKTPKINKKFRLTKSTKFSENTKTNSIASSIRTISKYKTFRKGKIYINLDNFHKQFLLNQNKFNYTLAEIYSKNEYNSIFDTMNSICISNDNNSIKKNLINLKKKSPYVSFLPFSSAHKFRNISINNVNNKTSKEFLANTDFSSFIEQNSYNKKIHFGPNINMSKNINNFFRNESNGLYQNNICNTMFLSPPKNKGLSKKSENESFFLFDNNKRESSKNDVKSFIKNNTPNKERDKEEIILKNKERKYNCYIFPNRISINEKLGFPSFNSYLFSRGKRYENVQQFLYKTRLLIKDKYLENINKDNYNKQISESENNLDKNNNIIKNLELIKKLLFSYNKTLDEYLRFIFKKLREIREENEILNLKLMEINKDIEKMRNIIIRNLNIMREGLSIKFFLMCVKNETLFLNKFIDEDIKTIENDKLKLSYYYTIYSNTRIKGRQKSLTNKYFFKKKTKNIGTRSSEKNLTLRIDNYYKNNSDQIKSDKPKINFTDLNTNNSKNAVFDSVEDFFQYFEQIITKTIFLIKESNDKYVNNIYLKIELENIKNNSKITKKDSILLNYDTKLYEQNLETLKKINKNLSLRLNNYRKNKFNDEVKMVLVSKNIYLIYNNLRKICDITPINKVDTRVYGRKVYLKNIEEFFIKISRKVLEDKKKYPIEYEKLNQQIEKKKKRNDFLLFQRLLAQKLEIKIDTILQKASKIIYRKFRKTNDYKEYSINSEIIKKMEKKKRKMDLFFEYFDDNNE